MRDDADQIKVGVNGRLSLIGCFSDFRVQRAFVLRSQLFPELHSPDPIYYQFAGVQYLVSGLN
jgi:hypothetical protein